MHLSVLGSHLEQQSAVMVGRRRRRRREVMSRLRMGVGCMVEVRDGEYDVLCTSVVGR